MTTLLTKADAAIAELRKLIEAGGGEMRIDGSSHATSFIRAKMAPELAVAGFRDLVLKFDSGGVALAIVQVERKTGRGAPKSDLRLELERLKQGGAITYDVEADEIDIDNLRSTIQAIQRANEGWKFRTESHALNITVVRVDGTEEEEKVNKYPFARLEVGQSETLAESADIETVRVMAQYYKRKHHKAFSVNKTTGGVKVTRIT